jgi:2-polyprenyl-3-methyl-5-hydroxy-6-metoxy-1,4-benzoquinol methylase
MEFTGERFIPGIKEYDQSPIAYEHWQRYYSLLNYVKGKTVLDIACGEGYGSNLISQYAEKVFGADISSETIHHAKSRYSAPNLNFSVESIENLDHEDQSIDIIVSFETIEHVDTNMQEAFLREAVRVLKPEGVVILSCPNKKVASDDAFENWGYKNEFHIKEYYLDEFDDFLRRHFRYVHFYYQRYENVLVLSSAEPTHLEVILRKQEDFQHTQNMLAICSHSELAGVLDESIVLENPGNHGELIRNLANAYKQTKLIQEGLEITETKKNKIELENEKLENEYVRMQHRNQELVEENKQLLEYKFEHNRLLNTRSMRFLHALYTVKQRFKSIIKRGN